ncbi:MAG: S41 family peptidase, partial [Psychrosphaera sp.]|nr:S41 family peptidase [Psychrosphaera sp.]
KAQIKIVINNIVRQLNQTYIYPQKAKSASTKLTFKLNTGVFGAGSDFLSFRRAVISTLVKATSDSGFDLTQFSDEDKQDLDNVQNADIRSEMLDNNIGYLQISGDFNFPKSSELIEQYFNNIAGTDALIIDLRSIDKGSVALTQKMIGFFVEPGKAIGSIKSNNGTQILKTIETKGFKKFKQNFPLYILNSGFVTGPWELCSYSLQALEKATVVGEVTMGVGFVNTSAKVGNNLVIEMTSGIVTGPDSTVTLNDQGVVPDYYAEQDEAKPGQAKLNEVKPDEVLKKAYNLALTQIATK